MALQTKRTALSRHARAQCMCFEFTLCECAQPLFTTIGTQSDSCQTSRSAAISSNCTVRSEGSGKLELGLFCVTCIFYSSGESREMSGYNLCRRPKSGAASHSQAVQPLQRGFHAYYRQPSAVWGCFGRGKIHDDRCQVCQLLSQCLAAVFFTDAYQTMSSLLCMIHASCCQQVVLPLSCSHSACTHNLLTMYSQSTHHLLTIYSPCTQAASIMQNHF